MSQSQRVVENLNHALHAHLAADPHLYLLGEDVLDPYGGAFKVTKGLSTAYGERVLGTPLSEGGIVGVAGGLALAGEKALVEIMFGDFAALAFDQLLNFASKSVSMYGRQVPMHLVVRCPSGGGRGYGPTHSQSLQKHFVGIPGLALYEMSPFHDNHDVLGRMLGAGSPCVFFEDKVLYTHRMAGAGVVDELFQFDFLDPAGELARVYADDADELDCLVIGAGGMTDRALTAMRELLLVDEIAVQLVVPSRLHPFDVESVLPLAAKAGVVCVVEESTAGGTWGAEVAALLHTRLWETLRRPVRLVHSADSIIPTATHLEREVLVGAATICAAVRSELASRRERSLT